MLDDILDIAEVVIDAVFGLRKINQELSNDLVALMQQAHEGKSLSGALISADGVSPDALCCPLTPVQLRDMRACTEIRKHRLAFVIAESKGLRTRHIVVLVTVDFEGVSGSGIPVSIHADRVPVHVTLSGRHPRIIEEIAAYPMV